MKYTNFLYFGFLLIIIGTLILGFSTYNNESIIIIFPFVFTTNNIALILITISIFLIFPFFIMYILRDKYIEVMYKRCPICGEMSRVDAQYCWNCGYEFNDTENDNI